jgi:hypothetical protein
MARHLSNRSCISRCLEQSSLELRTQQEELPAAASPLASVVEKSQELTDRTCHSSSSGQNHLDLSREQPFVGSAEGDLEVPSRQPNIFKFCSAHCQELPNEGPVERSTRRVTKSGPQGGWAIKPVLLAQPVVCRPWPT